MNDKAAAARDDLAFMRGLVEAAGSRGQFLGGSVFLAAGLIYSAQCLLQWAAFAGLIPIPNGGGLTLGLGPTVLFLLVLGWLIWRLRGAPIASSAKAVNAAFSAAGLTNCIMIVVFLTVAWKLRQPLLWEIYPLMVFALQGAAWIIVFMLRRRLWMLAIGLGWYATAITMAVLINTLDYALVAGLALLLFMALPGLVMMRLARRSAEG
jgi:hypothetical protein